ncbi:hypothetical protein EXN66_Car021045 [Channa argus]|uniref:Uncharacterized protein n=1 Tax=Channa argus TaxID=215402 RepID=A0A6G1QS87_CHAAH|nr:hypothetical protein EXN66_Car021045 [Channa argus]
MKTLRCLRSKSEPHAGRNTKSVMIRRFYFLSADFGIGGRGQHAGRVALMNQSNSSFMWVKMRLFGLMVKVNTRFPKCVLYFEKTKQPPP